MSEFIIGTFSQWDERPHPTSQGLHATLSLDDHLFFSLPNTLPWHVDKTAKRPAATAGLLSRSKVFTSNGRAGPLQEAEPDF